MMTLPLSQIFKPGKTPALIGYAALYASTSGFIEAFARGRIMCTASLASQIDATYAADEDHRSFCELGPCRRSNEVEEVAIGKLQRDQCWQI